MDKTREEVHQRHLADPGGTPEANLAVPPEPDCEPNNGDTPHLEYYRKYISAGLRQGVARQKSVNRIQEIHQNPNEDPS